MDKDKFMEFKSQICTTIEQSKRLLELGLRKETADMSYKTTTHDFRGNEIKEFNRIYSVYCWYDESNQICELERKETIPAWSLHRLIELCPESINIDGYADTPCWFKMYKLYNKIIYETYYDRCLYLGDGDNLFDAIIYCIEWLIKEKHFNQEFLNEK